VILGVGEIKAKLNFEVHGATKSAIEAIEKAGGSVKIWRRRRRDSERVTSAASNGVCGRPCVMCRSSILNAEHDNVRPPLHARALPEA
jgi:cytidine deaminase